MLMNTGDEIVESKNGLVSTIGIAADGKVSYALEGSIFAAGSTMNWLRNNMGIISSVSESAQLAASINDNEGCYFVPAFAGLGAPWWDPRARGIVCGLTGASSRATIVRAACESMAYQSYDVLRAMEQDVGLSIERLSVDGGASRNEFIMQFQADLLDIPVLQCETVETTAIGAAYLAGLAVGYWEDLEELEQNAQIVKTFLPHMPAERREQNLAGWRDAVKRSLSTAQ